ncbi:hypothetical protein ACIN8IBEIGE_200033 [Acinetobacter sp. 8I-beige]|nr:hypothetical protein ACIN8IBEIGE_200033 [Acinetobacter sp. 8I-beige]
MIGSKLIFFVRFSAFKYYFNYTKLIIYKQLYHSSYFYSIRYKAIQNLLPKVIIA